MLVYEAMRDAEVEEFPVDTPVAATTGIRLAKPPLLVPVLRAGLGMVEQASALIPSAGVGFVGMARDEETHQPVPYLESLPADLSGIPVFVLDPMLATGGSMVHTIDLLGCAWRDGCHGSVRRGRSGRRRRAGSVRPPGSSGHREHRRRTRRERFHRPRSR